MRIAAIHDEERARLKVIVTGGIDTTRALLGTIKALAILGGKDAMADSPGIRRRLEAHAPRVQIRWFAEDGHFLRGQSLPVDDFLMPANRIT
ncbi:MAG: hypothetical protein WDN01_16590 [Rhizomicrobium sp.]